MSAYRDQLRATVAGSAAPYGYTLTLGGSLALASGRLGSPRLIEILLLIGGAVVAFVLIEYAAYGSLEVRLATSARPVAVWGNAHLVSAGVAVSAVSGLVHLTGATLVWAACGFVATSIYLLVNAAQISLAGRRARRTEQPQPPGGGGMGDA